MLSDDEAKALIEATEAHGYNSHGQIVDRNSDCTNTRASHNADQCVVDDADLAEKIFRRVRHALPAKYRGRGLVGINARMVFLRYSEGQFFKPHQTKNVETDESISLVTFSLFLNSDFGGGRSMIYSTASFRVIDPVVGTVLLRSNDITAEEPAVRMGVKYVLKADVMFSRRPP